jgi:hypothetical protein
MIIKVKEVGGNMTGVIIYDLSIIVLPKLPLLHVQTLKDHII